MNTLNWYVGWGMILAAFVTGAVVGLFFFREEFLGGCASFRGRILRLGHIAPAALGLSNVLFSISLPRETLPSPKAPVPLVVGGITMPVACFLSAWHPGFRHLFFIPV